MTKFDRVLTEGDVMDITSTVEGLSVNIDGEVFVVTDDSCIWFLLSDFAEKIERAVIAKTAEKNKQNDSLDDRRLEFEAWAEKNGYLVSKSLLKNTEYATPSTEDAWKKWKKGKTQESKNV